MRILNLIIVLVIVIAVIVVALQNTIPIDVTLLHYNFIDVKTGYVLVLSFAAGVLFGAYYMLYPYFKAKSEVHRVRKEYQNIYDELESLRTISIDDIPDLPETLDIEDKKTVNGEEI
jgi:uncharacterized integral membrane protein